MDTIYNYSALCAAILNPALTVETAISKFSPQTFTPGYSNDGEIGEMIRLREQGVTYKEIGKIFGLAADTVFHRMKRYKERAG